jgi:predicted MFS family arabinose efflux permease
MNMIYGVAWFGGSALLGILYDQTSAPWVALASAALQLAALPVFIWLARRSNRGLDDSGLSRASAGPRVRGYPRELDT